ANRGVYLTNVGGQVRIGGLVIGEGNNIQALVAEGVLLDGNIVGEISVEGNFINAQGAGVDFEDGVNDFTVRGNDITAAAVAGIVVHNATSGDIVIGASGAGEGNTVNANGATTYGVLADTVNGGDVSLTNNNITAAAAAVKVNALGQDFNLIGNSLSSSDVDLLARQVTGNVTIQSNSLSGFATTGLDLLDVG